MTSHSSRYVCSLTSPPHICSYHALLYPQQAKLATAAAAAPTLPRAAYLATSAAYSTMQSAPPPALPAYGALAYHSSGIEINARPEVTNPNSIYSHPVPAATNSSVSKNASRKRDRDVQNELLRGNVSAVDYAGCVERKNPSEWDNRMYAEQLKREAELKSIFCQSADGGSKGMLSQPTKVQSKKHQINSLAFSAAQMELDLLDAKGARLKTKSETQAKYGW